MYVHTSLNCKSLSQITTLKKKGLISKFMCHSARSCFSLRLDLIYSNIQYKRSYLKIDVSFNQFMFQCQAWPVNYFRKIRFKNVDFCGTARSWLNISIWFGRFSNDSTAQIRIGRWNPFFTWKAKPLLNWHSLGLTTGFHKFPNMKMSFVNHQSTIFVRREN